MSEEKRFRSGFTGVPNSLYLANLNDRDALYAFLRFEGDTFFGGLQSVNAYCQILMMGHRRVANLLEIWQREMAQPDSNRILTGSEADVSPANADSCGDTDGQMAGKRRANDRVLLSNTESESESESTKRANPAAQVMEIWPELVAIAAGYGKRWSATLTEERARFIAKLLTGKGALRADDLPKLMHGSYAMWEGTRSDSFDWKRHYRVEVIFQKSKRGQYLEAFESIGEDERSEFPVAEKVLNRARGAKVVALPLTAKIAGGGDGR
jgi:hypothetical protein